MQGEIRINHVYIGNLRETSTGDIAVSLGNFTSLETFLKTSRDTKITVGGEEMEYRRFRDEILDNVQSVLMSDEYVGMLTRPERSNTVPHGNNSDEQPEDGARDATTAAG